MVDELRIARLLRSLTDDADFLDAQAASGPDPDDPVVMRAVKYAFVTMIEAAIDVAHHLCASQGWGPPDTNAGAVALLGTHGVLTVDLGAVLVDAAGFRNVLVHDYVTVDDHLVLDFLGHVGDLRAFASAVADWMAAEG